MNAPRHTHDQRRIWQHFQNAAPESFAAAHPRLDYLLRQIARRSAAGTPIVLNIGIGDGYLERQAQARGWKIRALDPDEQAVARLAAEGIDACQGLIERLPLAAQSCDFVVASEVLEHLTPQQRTAGVAEIGRVLRIGGWFLGTVPYREILADQTAVCPECGLVFHRWGHQQSFDEADIRGELEPLFRVQRIGHTAFVRLRGRGLGGAVKSLARLALAKLGEPIAFPTLYWIARKSGRQAVLVPEVSLQVIPGQCTTT
ncbi:MAG: class I SAM-dependent methyltransferase [Pirellulaceae bacterium]